MRTSESDGEGVANPCWHARSYSYRKPLEAEWAECLEVVRKSSISVMTRRRRRLEPLDTGAVHTVGGNYSTIGRSDLAVPVGDGRPIATDVSVTFLRQ